MVQLRMIFGLVMSDLTPAYTCLVWNLLTYDLDPTYVWSGSYSYFRLIWILTFDPSPTYMWSWIYLLTIWILRMSDLDLSCVWSGSYIRMLDLDISYLRSGSYVWQIWILCLSGLNLSDLRSGSYVCQGMDLVTHDLGPVTFGRKDRFLYTQKL